jgi:hypothetical protein
VSTEIVNSDNKRKSPAGPEPAPADFDALIDIDKSVIEAFRIIRERKAAGGRGWGEPLDAIAAPATLENPPEE